MEATITLELRSHRARHPMRTLRRHLGRTADDNTDDDDDMSMQQR